MILQVRLFVHSITEAVGTEILISGNQTGLGMQRKPNFGPKIKCTDDLDSREKPYTIRGPDTCRCIKKFIISTGLKSLRNLTKYQDTKPV